MSTSGGSVAEGYESHSVGHERPTVSTRCACSSAPIAIANHLYSARHRNMWFVQSSDSSSTGQQWTLSLLSLGMAAHAFLVGGHLASMFLLTSMCWVWMALCGLRGRLDAAGSMAVVMTLITFISVVSLVLSESRSTYLAVLSLALLPSFVSWTCVACYIAHLRRQDRVGADTQDSDLVVSYAEFEHSMYATAIAEPSRTGTRKDSRDLKTLQRKAAA